MVENAGRQKDQFFLATLTITLSERSFPDFIRTGANSNFLPEFQARLSALQTKLEQLDSRTFLLPSKVAGVSSDQPLAIELSKFTVTTLSYSEGSVVAKVQLGCKVVAAATAFLAAYPVAKDGYSELRDDLISLATEIFEGIEEGAPENNDGQAPLVSYYFLRPEKAEENFLKKVQDSDPSTQPNNPEEIQVGRS